MKKSIIIIGILLAVIFALTVIFSLRFLLGGTEDNWLCQNGEWVKHGNPSVPMPTSGCAKGEAQVIKVETPAPNEHISSPIIVTGQARGTWYFEASFPIRLETLDGKVVASAAAQAQGDWMTENFVPFKAVLEYNVDINTLANLVLMKDNPSGLPANDSQVVIPVTLEANPATNTENISVKAYLLNNNLDPEISCTKAFPVERRIAKTETVGTAALEALLAGPTDKEKQAGYTTAINDGVTLNSLKITDGIARADFSAKLNDGVAGSCLVSSIRTQIDDTLKQFPTIKGVEISVDGNSEDVLQP
jgi:hypothetical protein